MVRNTFVDEYELADLIVDCVDQEIEPQVIGDYQLIESLLRALITVDSEFTIRFADFCDEELDNYDDYYSLEVDCEYGIFIEKTKRETTYLIGETDILFVHDDVDEEVYSNIEYEDLMKFTYEDREECMCDCCCDCDEYDHHGFTMSGSSEDSSWSKSFWSTDKELVQKMLDKWSND